MSIIHFASNNAPREPEVITLTGTSGTPITASDIVVDPANAEAGWSFNTDGTIDRISSGATFYANWSSYALVPGQDYWLRITANAGDAHTNGISTGSWLKVAGTSSANREFTWQVNSPGTLGPGSVRVEIATDSGGVTIVATGYYGVSVVEVEV